MMEEEKKPQPCIISKCDKEAIYSWRKSPKHAPLYCEDHKERVEGAVD